MNGTAAFLHVNDIEALYGEAILALRGVSLDVEEGLIEARRRLAPPGNGTAADRAALRRKQVRDRLQRRRLAGSVGTEKRDDPASLVAKGVVQALEGRHCFAHLTVEENLRTGAFVRGPSRR